jgi:hypothetical protein
MDDHLWPVHFAGSLLDGQRFDAASVKSKGPRVFGRHDRGRRESRAVDIAPRRCLLQGRRLADTERPTRRVVADHVCATGTCSSSARLEIEPGVARTRVAAPRRVRPQCQLVPGLWRGSGYEQAKAKLCRVEIEKVAVAFGPPA